MEESPEMVKNVSNNIRRGSNRRTEDSLSRVRRVTVTLPHKICKFGLVQRRDEF